MPVNHYENFPVASVLLPRSLRRPVEDIYRFARGADDIADEGDHPAAWRLDALAGYHACLDAVEAGRGLPDAGWERLRETIAAHRLPVSLFRDLLDAFAQDVVQTRYPTYADLEHYCRRSANPVGRLMLHLFGRVDAANLRDADAICTSLQLLNFCQDVAIDWKKDRIYIPQDEMRAHQVSEDQIARGIADARWRGLYAQQLERARSLLAAGSGLPARLPGRMGLELRAIVAGGERIGARLAATGGDVFRHRPVLTRGDWLLILLRTLQLLPAPRANPAALPLTSR